MKRILLIIATLLFCPSLVLHAKKSLKKQEKKSEKKLKKTTKKQDKKENKLAKLESTGKKQGKQEKLKKNLENLEEKETALKEKIALASVRWQLPDKRLRIDQVSFLGAHNALLSKGDSWLYAQQDWGLNKLLDNGIRALEFDLGVEGGVLKICHGNCDKGFSRWIKSGDLKNGKFKKFRKKMIALSEWLKKHPDEIVFIMIDSGRDEKIRPNQVDAELMTVPEVNQLILTPNDWNPADHNGEWPTLQWMNDKKKQIIVFNGRENDSPIYTYYQWRYIGCTPSGYIDPEKSARMRDESKKAAEQNPELQKLFQLNHFTDISEKWLRDLYKLAQQGEQFAKDAVKELENAVMQLKNPIKAVKNVGKSVKKAGKKTGKKIEKTFGGKKKKKKTISEQIENKQQKLDMLESKDKNKKEQEKLKQEIDKLKAEQAGAEEEKTKEVNKLMTKSSDNLPATIANVLNKCKEKGIMGGKNPNFLMLDWVEKFVKNYGFNLIKQWNDENESLAAI